MSSLIVRTMSRKVHRLCGSDPLSGRRERTDHDVIPVRISQRELHGFGVRAQVGFLFEPSDEGARPWQSQVEIVYTEKQEEAVARRSTIGAYQGWVLVGTPLVKTEQKGAIRIEDLPEVVVAGWCL